MAAIRTVRTDRDEIVNEIGEMVSGTPGVLSISLLPHSRVLAYTSEKSAISRSNAMGFCNVA